MKSNLVPINGWYTPDCYNPVGKRVDDEGRGLTGFFREEFKKHYAMLVLTNGYTQTRYKYPKVDLEFKSPMHRWENLNYVGGWTMRGTGGEDISDDFFNLQAVIQGLKPMGFISASKDRPGEVEKFINAAKTSGLPYIEQEHAFRKDLYDICICQHGAIGDLFDIEKVIYSYGQMGYDFTDNEVDQMYQLKGVKFRHYLNNWDYANPIFDFDWIKIGLLLGYPLESTFDRITNC